MDYDKLKTELTTDPLGRGYSGMSDAQVSDSLNTKNRQVDQAVTQSSLILANMVFSEYASLTADQKQWLTYMFSCVTIDIRTGTQTRAALLTMFGPGTTTRSNVQAALVNLVSRADELGLGDIVRAGDVAMVRAS